MMAKKSPNVAVVEGVAVAVDVVGMGMPHRLNRLMARAAKRLILPMAEPSR
jgi:hypothetical protein